MDSDVAQVRRFNRTVTQRVGALSDHYLSRERPLGEARMLWEIGPEGWEVKALRSRLDLDSGHASRLLRALEADGLVAVSPSPADGRVRTARLTPAGLAERALLDERSEQLAPRLLAPPGPPPRAPPPCSRPPPPASASGSSARWSRSSACSRPRWWRSSRSTRRIPMPASA